MKRKLQKKSKNPKRDWPSDFGQENGNYINTCYSCHKEFTGNKHRMTCRVCDTALLARVLRKYGIHWQVGGFELFPWWSSHVTVIGEIIHTEYFAGWLLFQLRWRTCKRKVLT